MPDIDAPASENPFDQMVGHGLGTEASPSPIAANPFDEMVRTGDAGQDPSQTSGLGAFATHAALGTAPAVGGLIGAARGAEAGAVAGALIPGLGESGIGEIGGGIVGGIMGGFGGSWATGKAQDYAVKQLPDTWRDPLEREVATTEKEHPTASFMGGLFPMAVTMTPFSAASELPANATAMQRIMQNPATARVFGGLLQGGIEAGQEVASGDPLDWRKVAISTGFGLVFNRPNALGTRIEAIGARARPAPVAPSAPEPVFPEVRPDRQSPDVGDFGDLYDALFPRGEPIAKPAPIHEDAILGLDAPTLFGAWGSRVAGPQITEEVFRGSQEMDPQTKMIAEDAERAETAVYKPPPAPDVGVVARVMRPELFDEHAEALARRDTLQRHVDELGEGPGAEAAKARLAEADQQVDQTSEQVAAAHRTAAEAVGAAPVSEEARITPVSAEGSGPSIDDQRRFIQQDLARRLSEAGRPREVAEADSTIDAESYVARSAAMQGRIGSPAELYLTRGDVIRTEDGKSFPQGKPPWIKGKTSDPIAAKAAVAGPAIDPVMAKAKAANLGIANLIDRLRKQGASAEEISGVVSRKMTPEEIEAIPEISTAAPVREPELAQGALPIEAEAAQPVAAAYEAQEKVSALTPSEQRRELPKFTPEADRAVPAVASGQLQPAGVYMFDPTELGVDAKRFQLKSGGDQYGVTGALRSVSKWDAAKAQAIMVWEDLTGNLWVADGHQRAGLARRLTEQGSAKDIQLPGILYREVDGVSADDIRAIAAVTNIANGSGSAIDGAKILRARPELMDGSVPLSAGKGRQAAALAHLGDEPFRMVVNDVVPEHFGAIVGEMIPNDHARQEAAIKAVARFEPKNADEASALIQRVAQAELAKGEEARQTSMFADLEMPESTAGEEMKIVGSAIKKLKGDKALFSRVVANAERIEQTGSRIARATAQSVVGEADIFAKALSSDAYSSGPVREVLIQSARELKNGTLSIGDASARILASIRARIEEGGLGGAGARGRPEEPTQATPATDRGPEGTRQELIPGVSLVTDRDRIEAAAAKPLRGGNADMQHEGLFGEAKDQRELFQDANAKIRLREGRRPKLTLMRTQNASTYLHERSHVYLANLLEDAAHSEASTPVRADAETARKWLGIKEGAQPTTSQHERWARTFEQYLREGVAPSARLAHAFAKMKNWLLDIYKSLKDMWGEDRFEENVSPNIRAVFDRLLSAEAQGPGTIIASSLERGKTIADIHETDAEEITNPFEAGAAAMRIDAEAARHEAETPPEVAHEIEAASAEVDAESEQASGEGQRAGVGEGADAGRGAVDGASERGQMGEDRGKPEPQPERGRVRVQSGAELSGEREPVGEGGGAGAGSEQRSDDRETTRPGEPPVPRPARTLDRDTPLVDKAGNIRIENLTTREDVAQAIRAAAAANDGFIGDRRGVITDAQWMDLAVALGMDYDTLNRRQIGQAFNAEQVLAARRLLFRSATDVAEKMRAAAIGTDEEVMAYALAKDRHQMIQAQVAGITAEAGRALRAFRNISGSTGESQAIATDQFIKQATGKTLYQLREEAKLGSALDTPEKVSKMMADAMKRNFSDKVLEYWINGLISGPATHVTYSIGNAILAAVKAGPETAVAAAIGGARHAGGRTGEFVRPGEIGARLRGALEGLPSALQAAAESFGHGATARLPGEKDFDAAFDTGSGLAPAPSLNQGATYADAAGAAFANIRGLRDGLVSGAALLRAGGIEGEPIFGSRYSPLGTIQDFTYRGVNVAPVGTLARLPSRFIASIHAFFRATNFSMEKSALAFRAASEERLVGPAFERRVGELWQSPTPEMMRSATHEATEATLMGKGGEFTQALAKLTNARVFGLKLGKFIDPFVRISGNIIEQTLVARTPLGILAPEIRADLMGRNGNIAQDTAQARMLVGTALAATFGGLAASGYASGSGPSDPRKAAVWRLAGNQAHSVRVGDLWYDVHRLGPMGMLMSVAADMYDVAHAASRGDMLLAGATLQHALTQNILDESFMKGPADLIQAMEDPGRYGEAYLRNWASSFVPYSVGMAQLARASDPYSRQARTVMDAIRAKVPGESETLFPRRDVWGEPLANPDALIAAGVTSIYERRMSADPVNLAMLNLGIAPASLERKIRTTQLDDAQYDDFQRIAGRMTKQRLDIIVNSQDFQSWPSHVQHDVIQETIRQSREAARGVLMMKYPQIITEAMDAKRARLTDSGQ